jgi:hypothetical protein
MRMHLPTTTTTNDVMRRDETHQKRLLPPPLSLSLPPPPLSFLFTCHSHDLLLQSGHLPSYCGIKWQFGEDEKCDNFFRKEEMMEKVNKVKEDG